MINPVSNNDSIGSGSSGSSGGTLFDDEVEVMPGVYLIKRKQSSAPLASDPSAAATAATAAAPVAGKLTAGPPGGARLVTPGGVMYGEVTLSDNVEFLQQEAARLSKSVELLLKTNAELREAEALSDDSDPVFTKAIRENVGVVSKQLDMIKAIEDRLQELLGSRGPRCAAGTLATPAPAPAPAAPVVVVASATTSAPASTNDSSDDGEGGVFL
ncbi:hypothetical protein BC831DRAFT_450717 [Entophlyctis helioformis]|nr:hypothetical protein BC831DRAFT_450717 [Entophlyctis helioformis]